MSSDGQRRVTAARPTSRCTSPRHPPRSTSPHCSTSAHTSRPTSGHLGSFLDDSLANQFFVSRASLATSGVHLPVLPLFGAAQWKMHSDAVVAGSRRATDTETRHSTNYDSSLYSDQLRLYHQRQQKRQRLFCSSMAYPQFDLTTCVRSTAVSEDGKDVIQPSTSSLLCYHHQNHPYRALSSSPYTSPTSGSSFLLPPWPVYVQPAVTSVQCGFGVVRAPVDDSASSQPAPGLPHVRRHLHTQRRPAYSRLQSASSAERRQQLSTSAAGTDAGVTHHCTSTNCTTASTASSMATGWPLNEEYDRHVFANRSLSLPTSHVRHCLPPFLTRQPGVDTQPSYTASLTSTSPVYRPAGHRRGRFSCGSLIQLASGQWKRVDELSKEDFMNSASVNCDLQLAFIDVTHILYNHDRDSVVIGFRLSSHQTQTAVETTHHHPFFVCSKGWCSCSPERTKRRYGLSCKQLVVGDCCVALSNIMSPAVVQPEPVQVHCRTSSVCVDRQTNTPLDYSTPLALVSIAVEPSRPGVIQSSPAASQHKQHRTVSDSTAAGVVSNMKD